MCVNLIHLRAGHNVKNNIFFVQIDPVYQKCERNNLSAVYIMPILGSIIMAPISVRHCPYTISLAVQLNIVLYMVTWSFQSKNINYLLNICNIRYVYVIRMRIRKDYVLGF